MYIFDPALGWQELHKLSHSSVVANDALGSALAMSSDHLVATTPTKGGVGAAFVFALQPDGSWLETATLIPPGATNAIGFGHSVALAGERVVLGAPYDSEGQIFFSGSAYLFLREASAWTFDNRLTAPQPTAADYAGLYALGLSGDRLLLGATGKDGAAPDAGAAFVIDLGEPQPCAQPSDCTNDICVDGYCCDNLCGQACHACNVPGREGLCTAHADFTDPEDECVDGACRQGACHSNPGVSCSTPDECLFPYCVDGVCCTGGCTETCRACDVTGSEGQCSPLPSGTDPDDECASGACDGGACKLDDGQSCTSNSHCLSGFCRDGVCCNGDCGGVCRACDLVGSVGTCLPIAAGDDPANECGGGACNGLGACAKNQGSQCSEASECLSGHCVDGRCCDDACGGDDHADCQACSVAFGAVVDGVCAVRESGTMCRSAAGICDVAESCDGTSPACPADVLAEGVVCRPADGACDLAEICDGVAPNCPADAWVPAGTICRDAVGTCDLAESCTGIGPSCPDDAVAPAGTPCREADGPCDEPDSCDGDVVYCPNRLAENGTACDDGNACTADDTCAAGQCLGEYVCAPPEQAPVAPAGCSCRAAPTKGSVPWWLGLVVTAVIARRRTRRTS